MAEAAPDMPDQFWRRIGADLRPFPGRLEFALRLTAICVLTALACEMYGMPDAALIVYIAFFLNKPDRVGSLLVAVAMLVLITMLIAIIFLLANPVLDQPFRLVTTIAIISFCVLFLASASKLAAVGGTLTLILAFGLDELGQIPQGELATRVLFYVWGFVAIPAGVSIVVNLLVAPPPRRLAQADLARLLRLVARMLRGPDAQAREACAEALGDSDAEMQAHLKFARMERTSPPEDLDALSQAARSSITLLTLADAAEREPSARLPDPLCAPIAQAADQAATILASGGYPVNVTLPIAENAVKDLPPRAAAMLSRLTDAMTRLAEPVEPQHPAPAPKSSGFFKPDAFSNPDYVRQALKTTAAAMFCYVLYQMLDWPKIHTCMITCYIVSLGTTAETVQKLTLRIIGCMIGTAFGMGAIVFVVPHLTSIDGLLASVFVGILPAAWVAVGSPGIAYAGYQIAFALLLCLIQGSGPSIDMVTARDRVIGILLGNVAAFVINTTVWPVSVGARIGRRFDPIMRSLRNVATAPDADSAHRATAEAQHHIGEAERDLELIRQEPPDMRPADSVIRRWTYAIGELRSLCGLLLLSGPSAASGRAAARIAALSAPAGEEAPTQPFGDVSAGTEAFGPLLDLHLDRLEATIAAAPPIGAHEFRDAAT
jgi:multidrug resistance protein MdtO